MRWFNPLSAKLKKQPNTLKQFVGNLPTNCLSVFGHFMGFALKRLILSNKPFSLKNTYAIETGLSDLHKSCQKCKGFHNETFLASLRHELNVQGQNKKKKGLDAFSTICAEIFDYHAPKKKRYIWYNHKRFINNEVSKAIMTRSRLRHHYLRNRS